MFRVGDQDGMIGRGIVLDSRDDTVALYALEKAIEVVSNAGHPVFLAFAGDRHQDNADYNATSTEMYKFVKERLENPKIGPKVTTISAESEFDNEERRGRTPRDINHVADLFQAVIQAADDAKWTGTIVAPAHSTLDEIGRKASEDLYNALKDRGILSRVNSVGLHLYAQNSSNAITNGVDACTYAYNLWQLPLAVDQAAVTGTASDSTGLITPVRYMDALAAALPLDTGMDTAGREVRSFLWWWPAVEGVTDGVLGNNPSLVTQAGELTDLGKELAALRKSLGLLK